MFCVAWNMMMSQMSLSASFHQFLQNYLLKKAVQKKKSEVGGIKRKKGHVWKEYLKKKKSNHSQFEGQAFTEVTTVLKDARLLIR